VWREKQLIAGALAHLDEVTVFKLVRKGLAKGLDQFLLVEAARDGVKLVSEKYHRGEYFLADLIMSAEIFREVIDLAIRFNPPKVIDCPPVIFGTVKEDIHDIGKNIVIGLMRCRGLQVLDLGVDVAERDFLAALKSTASNILCLTGLITPAYDSMRRTIALLEEEGMRDSTSIIIGGLVNEAIREYVKADYFSTDASEGVPLCLKIINKKTSLKKKKQVKG